MDSRGPAAQLREKTHSLRIKAPGSPPIGTQASLWFLAASLNSIPYCSARFKTACKWYQAASTWLQLALSISLLRFLGVDK